MKQYFNTFFNSKTNRLIIVIAAGTTIFTMLYYSNIKPYPIFPKNNNIDFSFFTDCANSGSSEVYNTSITDSSISFEFLLKEGFSNPYVGLHIKKLNKGLITSEKNNQILLDIYSEGINNLGFYLNSFNQINKKTHEEDEINFYYSIKLHKGRNTYLIDLEKLIIPDWFKQSKGFDQNFKLHPNKNKISYINITTDYPSKAGDKGKIALYDLKIKRNNHFVNVFLIVGFIALMLVLLLWHALKFKLWNNSNEVVISYKPIAIDETNDKQKEYLNYIHNHFNDPQLTLELLSQKTSTGQRTIASAIQEEFGCNFKTYINQIRINESKRLLKESTLNIGEIAFKVGFNNQSHFNRVFKNITNLSPTEYRD